MPEDFAADPWQWLAAVSREPGPVLSGGPGFAYDRCVERIPPERRARLDLSGWRWALNGAERIRRGTLEAFTHAFEPYGFRADAWLPAYGLTEVTLGVSAARGARPRVLSLDAAELEHGRAVPTAPRARSPGRRVVDVVGCGRPHPRTRVLIVDPERRTERRSDEVGEVWVAGDIVNQGYWRRPEETEAVFSARLASGEGPFLRTGDLAFRHDGALYPCGRRKELIIIRGRNIHPPDVEAAAARALAGPAPEPAAAFSVDTPEGEHLIVVQAVADPERHDLTALGTAVRAAVADDLGVEVHQVVLVRSDGLPTTRSGKVRRTACRQAYVAGLLDPIHTTPARGVSPAAPPGTPPRSEIRATVTALPAGRRAAAVAAEVRRRVADLLAVRPASVEDDVSMAAQGLGSLRAIELHGSLSRDFDVRLPLSDFLQGDVTAVTAGILRRLDEG